MSRAGAGRGLMAAGVIVTIVGLGNVAIRTLDVPGYWMPVIVGIALLVAGAIVWATSRRP